MSMNHVLIGAFGCLATLLGYRGCGATSKEPTNTAAAGLGILMSCAELLFSTDGLPLVPLLCSIALHVPRASRSLQQAINVLRVCRHV